MMIKRNGILDILYSRLNDAAEDCVSCELEIVSEGGQIDPLDRIGDSYGLNDVWGKNEV